jgi:hypothetical protein
MKNTKPNFDCYPIDAQAESEIKNFYSQKDIIFEKYPRNRDLLRDLKYVVLSRFSRLSFSYRETDAKDQYEGIWSAKTVSDVFREGGQRDTGNTTSTNVLFEGCLLSSEMWSLNASIVSTFASYLRQEGQEKENILEIGSGNGFNLISLAAQFPSKNFIGLELTESGVSASNESIKDTQTVMNLCEFVFGSNNKYSGKPLNNIKFIQEDVTRLDPKLVTIDQMFSVLAQEQMEQVYYGFLSAIKKMEGTDFFFFEPYLDFNTSYQELILKTKKYLYRNSWDLKKYLGVEVEKFKMPMNINKQKYAFGILKGKIN